MTDRGSDWVQTFSGGRFWPLDPRPEEVDVYDLAHHLATTNRFAGAALFPVSVAQHSVHVCLLLRAGGYDEWYQKWGLLHDASEAYIGDVTRPLKRARDRDGACVMEPYLQIEQALQEVILVRFGLAWEYGTMPVCVKWADDKSLATEKRDVLAVRNDWQKLPDPDPTPIRETSWRDAEQQFLHEMRRLGLSA